MGKIVDVGTKKWLKVGVNLEWKVKIYFCMCKQIFLCQTALLPTAIRAGISSRGLECSLFQII